MHENSRSFRFARNVRWNLLGQIGLLAINFLATPYLVHRMGTETYGLYVLLFAASSYLLLLTFGAGSATAKFVAEMRAAGDAEGESQLLRYSAAFHTIGVALGALVLFAATRFFVVRVFHVPEALVPRAVFVIRCAATGAVFVSLSQFAASVLQGLQRFDRHNQLTLLQNSALPLGIVAAFWLGRGLQTAAAWYVAWNVASSLIFLAAVWALWRRNRPTRRGGGLELRRFFLFGASAWMGSIAWIVMFQVDKMFIAHGLSLSDLTLYAVPSGLLQRLQLIPAVISTVLVPMVSELQGDVTEDLSRMYLKTLRFQLWVLLPALVLLFVFLPQFLTLWLGAEFGGRGIWPIRILVLAQMLFLMSFVPSSIATGRGKVWYFSYVAWAQVIVSLVSWRVLIPSLHLMGVALGSLLAQLVSAAFYIPITHRNLMKLPFSRYVREGLYAPLLSAALVLAVVFPLHPLASSWGRLLGMILGGLVLYYGSTWFFFSAEDRELLTRFLRRRTA